MIIGISGKIGSGKDTVAQMIQYLEFCKSHNTKPTYEAYNGIFVANKVEPKSTWQIKRFADKLKDIVCLLIGCTREQLEDREFKEKLLGKEWNYFEAFTGSKRKIYASRKDFPYDASHFPELQMTPRKLMQLLGTEAGREIIHPNLWVNALFADYKRYKRKRVKCHRSDDLWIVPEGYGKHSGKRSNHEFYEWHESSYPNWIIPDTRFPNEAKAIKDRGGILIRVDRNNPDGSIYGWGNPNVNHPSETSLDDYKDWDYIIDNDGDLNDLLIKVKEIYEDVAKQTNFN